MKLPYLVQHNTGDCEVTVKTWLTFTKSCSEHGWYAVCQYLNACIFAVCGVVSNDLPNMLSRSNDLKYFEVLS